MRYNTYMKPIFFLIVVASLLFCGYAYQRTVSEGSFNISGTVVVPDHLIAAAQSNNNACAIIVKNQVNIPIAIKRIIDPTFPLEFSLDREDLLTGNIKGPLTIEVQINKHGQLGVIKQGDIFGSYSQPIQPTTKSIIILADKSMGNVKRDRYVKGNFFRSAAR